MRIAPLVFVVSATALAARAVGAQDLPNIVVVYADDLGYGDLSAYNPDAAYETPRLDRMAAEGIRFTDAHSPSTICSPSRAGLYSGQLICRTGRGSRAFEGPGGPSYLEPGMTTIADVVRAEGYRTAVFGKWHVGLRYRRSDGSPAAGWEDADLTKPLHTTPIDHGFDVAKFTSRSHGTSGPDAGAKPASPKKGKGKGKGKGSHLYPPLIPEPEPPNSQGWA